MTSFDAGNAMQNIYSIRFATQSGRASFPEPTNCGTKAISGWPRSGPLIVAMVFCFITIASGCVEVTPIEPPTTSSTPTKPADPNAVASKTATELQAPDTAATRAESDVKAAAEQSLVLQELDWNQLQELVASHKGKVVVVDLWSTSCEPCLREFPHLVAMQKQHPTDVVCISYDCDFIGAKKKPVSYYRERVLKFLESVEAKTIINTMSTVAADELFEQIDVASIPAVYVYDQSGKLAKRFDNSTPASATEEGISYETQIGPMVSELVKAAQN